MSTLSTTNLKHPSSGSNNIVLNTDGTTTIAAPSNIIKSGTAVASTSGTSIDFTGIPSWVKRITVMFEGVSTNGTSIPLIQLGDSGGVETTGYLGSGSSVLAGNNCSATLHTAGFGIGAGINAVDIFHGAVQINLLNQSTNTWTANGNLGRSNIANVFSCTGSKSLSATLDRVRITTTNGTDTFDAGTINILWEG